MAAIAAILKNLFIASSLEQKGQLTQNLVGSIGVTGRSKLKGQLKLSKNYRGDL